MNDLIISRRLILVALIALLVVASFRLSFVDGLLRRVTIDGPSMAPTFRGSHYSVTCRDCRFGFDCDAEHLPTDGRAACPNCGYTDNLLDDADLKPADQVLIDRWPPLWSSPRRGDVVAAALPNRADIAVKRIAGLPGEQLAIATGNTLAGDQIIRKSPAQARQVLLLVHDNHFQPHKTPGLLPRWQPAQQSSRWRQTDSGFRIDPSPNDKNNHDWLQYEHWKCTADPKTRGIPSPITDNDSYNQSETRRPLNIVNDVLLSCHVRANENGQFALAVLAGNQRFEVAIEPRKTASLHVDDQPLVVKQLKTDFSRRSVPVEFGLCDQQVLLVIEGRTIFCHPYAPPTAESKTEPLHALAIGAGSVPLEVTNLRVWRDLYYLDPQGLSRPWQMQEALTDNEYAVLGDNPPVSIDSRQWEPSGVPRSSLLGRVYRPFWASRRLD